MTVLQAVILGLIQGLTEFLPVSSSGHMLLAGKVMDAEVSLAFELVLHLATLLAVIIVMHKDFFALLKNPLKKESLLIIVATIPTVFIVFAFKNVFEKSFSGEFLPYCFLLTAILLLASSFVRARKNSGGSDGSGVGSEELSGGKISYFDAVVIGTVQGFAALPGISRSGSTISTSMLLGNEKKESARFSFLLSIPIILGSALVELVSEAAGGGLTAGFIGGVGLLPLACAFLAAFASGLIALKFMLEKLLKSFDFFALYLLVLAVFLFLNTAFLHWF